MISKADKGVRIWNDFIHIFLKNVSPKEKIIQLLSFSQNWGQRLCIHNRRDARRKKNNVKCTSFHSILDNGSKPRQGVFKWVK